MSIGPAPVTQFLLQDNFTNGAQLDPAQWTYNQYEAVNNPSYYGRTQIEQYLPSVTNGALQLTLQSYNPTGAGNSFLGSEIISTQTFDLGGGGNGIAFTAVAAIPDPVPGMVGGIFAYNYDSSTMLDNEADFELLSNIAAAANNQVQTNYYSDQPLGTGNPEFVSSPSLTAYQTYTVEWFPDRMLWFIDGQLVNEITSNVPQGPLAFHLNFWAPDTTWEAAYSSSLVPATSAQANTTYTFDVQSVSVATIGNIWATADFTGNGVSDVLFRDAATGDTGYYVPPAGGGSPTWVDFGATSTAYSVVGIGDYTGSGTSETMFRDTANGDTGFYVSPTAGGSTWDDIGGTSTAYAVVGTGDFIGDGSDQVLFQDQVNGDLGYFSLTASGPATWQDLGQPSLLYSVVGTGDFNGNGSSQILFRDNANGDMGYYTISAGGTITDWTPLGGSSSAYSVAGVGDFTGTGTTDILFRNNATGDFGYDAVTNGDQATWTDLGGSSTTYSVVAVGDFTGSGRSDILFRDNAPGDTGYYSLPQGGGSVSWTDLGGSSTAYSAIGSPTFS